MLDPQLAGLLNQLGYDAASVESLLKWAIYLTIASLVAAIPTGMIARRKGRSVAGWVVFELCIPVVPLLLLWVLPTRKPPGN